MPRSLWTKFFLTLSLKALIIALDNDLRQALLLVGLTTIVELWPVVQAFRSERRDSSIKSLDQFGQSGNVLVPLGALMMIATVGCGTAITAAMTNSSLSFDVPALPAFTLGELVLLMLVTPMAFVIGRWMGSASRPVTTIWMGAGNILTAYLIGMVMPMALLLVYMYVTKQLMPTQWIATGLLLLSFLVAAQYGHYTGRRKIIGMYMGYLLGTVPNDVRDATISRVYQDAIHHHEARAVR